MVKLLNLLHDVTVIVICTFLATSMIVGMALVIWLLFGVR